VSVILGMVAVVFAAINVVGGFMVTDRMLGMFKKGGTKKTEAKK
jgi:NAD(P) transhydrogenase subunit alpha